MKGFFEIAGRMKVMGEVFIWNIENTYNLRIFIIISLTRIKHTLDIKKLPNTKK